MINQQLYIEQLVGDLSSPVDTNTCVEAENDNLRTESIHLVKDNKEKKEVVLKLAKTIQKMSEELNALSTSD